MNVVLAELRLMGGLAPPVPWARASDEHCLSLLKTSVSINKLLKFILKSINLMFLSCCPFS